MNTSSFELLKPSEVIDLGLDAVAKVEKSPKYKVGIDTWHRPKNGVLHVDMAGAVMSLYLHADKEKDYTPKSFTSEKKTRQRLVSFDNLNHGFVDSFLRRCQVIDENLINEIAEHAKKRFTFAYYDENKTQFKVWCRNLQKHLQKVGL